MEKPPPWARARRGAAGELEACLVLFEIELQAGESFGLDAQHHHTCDWRSAASKSRSISMLGLLARPVRQQFFWPAKQHARARRGSSSMLERATRLCRMSPAMVTVTPASVSAVTVCVPA